MGHTNYLLVDDEVRIIDLLQGYVERRIKDANWETAYNGADAFKVARGQKFDFIITDFYMPELNGVELIQRIRKSDNPNRQTPIILLSAYNPNLIASHSDEFGHQLDWENVFFMDKPINMTQLDHYLKCCMKLKD